MNEKRPNSQGGGNTLGDVYFVLFRRKWIILIFSMLGIAGAAAYLLVLKPPQYQSDALLSIPYVVERKSLNLPGEQANTRPLNEQSASIINTEIAILNSQDLVKHVVQALTPRKILAKSGGGADIDKAVLKVSRGITVEPVPDSSVIRITYQDQDPSLVQPVLNEIIDAYLAIHVQLHRGLGVSTSSLTNEIARLRGELVRTDDELRQIKNAAGVVSLDDTQKSYADQLSKIQQNIRDAEAELAEHQEMVGELTTVRSTEAGTTNVASATEVPPEQAKKYRKICSLLAYLEGKEQDYLTKQGFTTENVLVKQNHELIVQNETLKKELEAKYPALTVAPVPLATDQGQPDQASINLKTETDRILGLKAKIRVLNAQLNQVWSDATNFEKVQITISELEQKKAVDESNLKYLKSNLEESHFDKALGEDKAGYISIIQHPSAPTKEWAKAVKKRAKMLAAGGLFGGLALAFFLELFLNRSVKRPADIEAKLQLPLLISIPAMAKNGHYRSAKGNDLHLKDVAVGETEAVGNVVASSGGNKDLENRKHPIRRFSEGLRDRLIVYFETRNLDHKPKLLAVTSCNKGAGVSTIASGVAASLSETGDGNVLLVNISGERGAAQQFYKGKPGYSLDEALAAKELVSDNQQGALVKADLYTTVEQSGGDMLPANLPKKIAALMPRFKASEYDYIIFDMPPVSQTSVTARLSGLMDMVLLVIESEKTNQDAVKRVNQLLAESKATVGTVLNKTKNYVPARLHQEYLND